MKTLFNSVETLESAMTFHRERHTVLSGNLANLDTPGYQPLDLERVDGMPPSEGGAAGMVRTDGHHLGAASDPGSSRVFADGDQTSAADGNAVNLEREMAKIAANRVRYATSSELVSRRLALLRYTATDGNG